MWQVKHNIEVPRGSTSPEQRWDACLDFGICPQPMQGDETATRAPSLCLATVPLEASAGFNGICNRQ